MSQTENDIIALKKMLLNNEDIQKLIMHYRLISKNNDSEIFQQNHDIYNNKYEFNDSINIKEKYLDKTLSNDDIKNNLQSNINNTNNLYNSLVNNALTEILEYLKSIHINESELNNVINNYIDHLYVSLDSRYMINNVNMHSIDENLLFSEKDKLKIEETIQ